MHSTSSLAVLGRLIALVGAVVLSLSCEPLPTDRRFVDAVLAGGSLEVGAYYLASNDLESACRQLERLQNVLDGGEYSIGLVGSVDTSPIATLLAASRERDVDGMTAALGPADKALREVQTRVYGNLAGLEDALAPQLITYYHGSVRTGRVVNHQGYADSVAIVRAFARSIHQGREGAASDIAGSMVQRDGGGYLGGALTGFYFKRVERAFKPLSIELTLPAPEALPSAEEFEGRVQCFRDAIRGKEVDEPRCPEAVIE